MKVVVEVLTGTLFYVEVADDAKVSDLKREIETQRKLPAERLILFLDSHGNRHLIGEAEDGDLLVDLGVEDEEPHFYLFFKPLDHMVVDTNVHQGLNTAAESATKPSSTPATPVGMDESKDE